MIDWIMYGQIQELKRKGFKKTRVAEKLSLNFRTVDKYWDMKPDEFSAVKTDASERIKKADTHRDEILDWIMENPDMDASQIYDWLIERHNSKIDFAERTLRRYVKELRESEEIPKVVDTRQHEAVEDLPLGYQAQVDMGECWQQREDGSRIKLYCFAMVLSNSRYKYVLWQTKPFTTDSFVRAHEKAFAFMGGMPREIVYDQDKVLAVSENNGDIIYTEGFQNYISIQKFKIYLCRGADPQSKGKVEAVVKYAKRNFARHRKFTDIDSWNDSCLNWLHRRANGKKHEITQKIPAEVFTLEKEYLTPATPFKTVKHNDSVPYQVRKDNSILYRSNRYRVPKGTYRPGLRVLLDIRDNVMLIKDMKTYETIVRHTISDERGKLIKLNHEGRDTNNKLKEIYEQALNRFASKEEAEKFIEKIRELKPRYIRDQLGVIIAVGNNEKLRYYMNDALKYCVKNHLYSATEFKAATEYFMEISKCPEPLDDKPSLMIKPPCVRPQIRDISEYGKLMEV